MVKKRVPDWLNSSLWSSAPSSDGHQDLRYSATTPPTTYPTEERPAVDPPVPVSSPPSPPTREGPPEPQRIEDSRINNVANDHNGTSSPLSTDDISRQAQLLAELSRKVIDIREVRRIACQGIPDGAGIRSTVWKILLGYLPLDRGLWSSELGKKRSQYNHFKEEILMNPGALLKGLKMP